MRPNTEDGMLLDIQDIRFSYSDTEKPILSIEKWGVKKKESVFLIGESGSGKSTFIHLLSGLTLPSSGKISINNVEINTLSTRKRDRFRSEHIGLVYQQLNLIPYLSLLDNVISASIFAKRYDATTAEKARVLLQEMQLSDSLFDRKAEHISIGQQQRVAIARALINEPSLLLMDEPTSSLDTHNRDAFLAMLMKTMERHESTLIFASHDSALSRYFDTSVDLTSLNKVDHQTL